jgi:hypothetical protein
MSISNKSLERTEQAVYGFVAEEQPRAAYLVHFLTASMIGDACSIPLVVFMSRALS